MKKIIFLFALLIGFALSGFSQDNVSISETGSNFLFALDAGDTILNTNTLDKVIDVRRKDAVQMYNIQVTLDSISGTPAHTTVLAGSNDGVTYKTISTVSWTTGAPSDTTFYFTDVSTGVAWQYLRVRVTGSSSSKSQLTLLAGKVVDKGK